MRIEKYIEERFDGPWYINGVQVHTPSSVMLGHFDSGLEEAMHRYNMLLDFTCRMAEAFNDAHPEKFKDFYYNKPKKRLDI